MFFPFLFIKSFITILPFEYNLGSLSYEPSRNLSLYTGIYCSEFIAINKEIRAFREVTPSGKCPFCPVISAPKVRNSLKGREIGLFALTCPDIGKIYTQKRSLLTCHATMSYNVL
jgi:hypothetical protein